jgi:hypothetical protein
MGVLASVIRLREAFMNTRVDPPCILVVSAVGYHAMREEFRSARIVDPSADVERLARVLDLRIVVMPGPCDAMILGEPWEEAER